MTESYRHSLLRQVVAHGSAALFGKLLIVFVAADAVGVTFHIQPQTRVPGDDAGDLGQFLAGQGADEYLAVSKRTSDMFTIKPRAVSRV